MIALKDGRPELYQWDTGRILNVPTECSQVHFSNKIFGRSIDVDVVNGEALIPDILLQSDKELEVWAFVGTSENGYTKISKKFKVNKRNKPADYVFTPTEQKTLDDLDKKVNEFEHLMDTEYVKTDDIDSVIDDALLQAKESGEFDGKDGEPGQPGKPGRDGTDATVTAESIQAALGYTPADQDEVDRVKEALEGKVPFRYITLTVKSTEGDTDIPTTITTSIGDAVYATVTYEGAPVTLAIPDGVNYQIAATSEVHHGESFYYNPTVLKGVATKDVQTEIIYSKLGAIHSFVDVKAISDRGLAPQYFQVGDVLTTTYTDVNGTEYECPWIVVSTAGATLADGTVKESGVHLQMQYTTVEAIQYDAPELEQATEETAQEGMYYYRHDGGRLVRLNLAAGDPVPYSSYPNVYHNEIKDASPGVLNYGYNRETHSAMRQWLNSDAPIGSWWQAQHIGDCAPAQLNSVRGFLAGLPKDFVDAMSEIRITQTLNTASEPDITLLKETYTAKVFLPHLEQMYIRPYVVGEEGDPWDYYRELAGDAGVNGMFQRNRTYPILISYALENHSSAQKVRLASVGRNNSCDAWFVNSVGNIDGCDSANGGGANEAFRCRPACFI